jgi:AraC family transcriptional regulator, regulatory protein of adaptative response / methylated-DNA-[protein]-cysteine methyltransferase
MKQTASRRSPEPIRYAVGNASIGKVLLATSSRGLCAILIGDEEAALKHELAASFPGCSLSEDAVRLAPLLPEVAAYVDGAAARLDHPLDPLGTPFQQRVWETLCGIPAGSTLTYTEVAARAGYPGSVRAVAGACAANRLAVVIPCHRVIRRSGALAGYRWGLDRKRLLLAREAAAASEVR